MTLTPAPRDETFLESFFGPPNDLLWRNLNGGQVNPQVEANIMPWVELLITGGDAAPVVLPFYSGGRLVCLYAAAASDQGASELAEELEGVLGRTYADFHPGTRLVDPRGPIDQAVAARFGTYAFRIACDKRAGEETLWEVLRTYRALLQRKPPRGRQTVRPFGRIRASFEQALLARNESEANACIVELRKTGRLNAQNERFLRLRVYASLGRWRDIVGDPNLLRAVGDLRLPTEVLASAVEAIYQVFLAPHEAKADAQGAVSIFRDQVAVRYGRLFRTRKGIRRPPVIMSFLVGELTRPSPRPEVCTEMVAELPSELAENRFVRGLLNLAGSPKVVQSQFAVAEAAFDDERFDAALPLYLACPPSRKALQRALFCVRDANSLDSTRKVLALVSEYPEAIVLDLPESSRRTLESLRGRLSKTGVVPQLADWWDWADWVSKGLEPEVALDVARQGTQEWAYERLAGHLGSLQRFVTWLQEDDEGLRPLMRDALPLMYRFFCNDRVFLPSYKPIYLNLLLRLALQGAQNETSVSLVYNLTAGLLGIGLDRSEYGEMIGDHLAIQADAASFKFLNSALDLTELLAIHPCPDLSERTRLFVEVLKSVPQIRHRILPDQWLALGTLSRDFGVEEYLANLQPPPPPARSKAEVEREPQRIAIYTLIEGAGSRAKNLIEQLYPGFVVEVASDLVATDRLVALARSADVFVFASLSASHQAYYCVKDNRPPGKPPLQPPGKGSTSIVRCLSEHYELTYA